MEKRYGILILGTFACAACLLLSACAGPAAEQSSVQPPYDGQTQVSVDNRPFHISIHLHKAQYFTYLRTFPLHKSIHLHILS